MGAITKLVLGPMFTLGTIAGLASLTAPDDPGASRPATAVDTPVYSHELLQSDTEMTQQMSAPGANTSSQFHREDGQLARSQRPGYVRALEAHQAALTTMLAQPSP